VKGKAFFYQSFLYIIIAILSSCVSPKKILYFNGDEQIVLKDTVPPEIIFAPNDILNIMIYALDPEAVKPFVNASSDVDTPNSGNGYLIDAQGMIYMPVIGDVKIAGLTRIEAAKLLQDKLKDYIKDPVVDVRLKNFKITILGEVGAPGVYTIDGERATLAEVIGMAGDLKISAMRNDIRIIRDANGNKIELFASINTKDFFNSNAFYLKQNDIIYVKPNRLMVNTQAVNYRNIAFVISITSFVITLVAILGLKN
jgi:polysaccharide export outer membrane protein